MALLRTPPAGARTIVQGTAPWFVSHHHAGPRIHLGVALQVTLAGPGHATVESPRPRPARIPQPILRATVAHPISAGTAAGRAPALPAPRRPSPVALQPVTHPAYADPSDAPAAPAVTTVVTTLRREERLRLETVLRRTGVEIAPAPASAAPPPVARPGEALERPRAARPSSPPPPAAPLAVSESEIGRLADRVVQRIQRRIVSQRERMGGH
jgi:hypothetical protein